jgi:hypothetical protein
LDREEGQRLRRRGGRAAAPPPWMPVPEGPSLAGRGDNDSATRVAPRLGGGHATLGGSGGSGGAAASMDVIHEGPKPCLAARDIRPRGDSSRRPVGSRPVEREEERGEERGGGEWIRLRWGRLASDMWGLLRWKVQF